MTIWHLTLLTKQLLRLKQTKMMTSATLEMKQEAAAHMDEPLFTFEMVNTSNELFVKSAKSTLVSWSPLVFTGRRIKIPMTPANAKTLKLQNYNLDYVPMRPKHLTLRK